MTPQRGLALLRLGRMLERADKTSRILDVKYFILLPTVADVGTPYDDIQWAAVLRSVSGFEMYRKRHGRIAPERIVEFLLLDGEFPRARAVLHRSWRRSRCTRSPAAGWRALFLLLGAVAGPAAVGTRLRAGGSILQAGLHEFFDALQAKMNTVDECILARFFRQKLALHMGQR